tara:strand:+ start:122 stop:319 length:198 start_codon:yes stop_codon:yes gene_type:complete
MKIIHFVGKELEPSIGCNHQETKEIPAGPHYKTMSKKFTCDIDTMSWPIFIATNIWVFFSITKRF